MASCLRGRGRARHRNRADPSARRGAVRLRHRPGRTRPSCGSSGRGTAGEGGHAVEREAGGGWRTATDTPAASWRRTPGRNWTAGRGSGPRHGGASGSPEVRGHRHRAGRAVRPGAGNDRRVRGRLSAAFSFLMPDSARCGGGVGRGSTPGGAQRFPGDTPGPRWPGPPVALPPRGGVPRAALRPGTAGGPGIGRFDVCGRKVGPCRAPGDWDLRPGAGVAGPTVISRTSRLLSLNRVGAPWSCRRRTCC